MLVKNPEQASNYLNKLSDILRYSLFETDNQWVPLNSEIEYLNRYLELQALRTHVKDYAVITISVETSDVNVAPFVFMPFVENAFKHSARISQARAIQIELKVAKNQISFSCMNIIPNYTEKNDGDVGGIGNDLIRKRLELIYGSDHELSLQKSDNSFHVQLTLKCSDIPV